MQKQGTSLHQLILIAGAMDCKISASTSGAKTFMQNKAKRKNNETHFYFPSTGLSSENLAIYVTLSA